MAQPNFLKIGYETKIEGSRRAGPVIATPTAIYCVLGASTNMSTLVAGAVGGAIGGAIAGAISGRASDRPGMVPVGDLPEELRAPGTGPFRRFPATAKVFAIPRGSVSMIEKNSLVNNTLQLVLDGATIVINHKLFGGAKVRQYLADSGWPLNWRGQRFN